MELNYKYDGTDDHMDSRDIQEDIEKIEQHFGLDYDQHAGPDDFADVIRQMEGDDGTAETYLALIELRDDAASANEGWEYGIQFVRTDSADEEWAQQRVVDLGFIEIPSSPFEEKTYAERIDATLSAFPYKHLDWQAVADELMENSTEFVFRGVSYFED